MILLMAGLILQPKSLTKKSDHGPKSRVLPAMIVTKIQICIYYYTCKYFVSLHLAGQHNTREMSVPSVPYVIVVSSIWRRKIGWQVPSICVE
jgi:hypothetical protein